MVSLLLVVVKLTGISEPSRDTLSALVTPGGVMEVCGQRVQST